ncbi:endonuclease/exonuclease/phosphatase family metal-dependent hydrolase [Catenulispora sp. GAS73]|uniref:endonuclease/exonuclease/phosphatase family protein n=1 Tax=Catenulispora sp. GAS73 TaxID=3156269 RepID=UPI003516613C
MISVATWNILHRVHAENWGEDTPRHWPDEAKRIAAITARLMARAEQVIALQEVSGDQLADLIRALPADRTVHALRYPRVPSPRHGTPPLEDLSEHLVLVVKGPARQVAAEAFDDDPGKGLLAIHTGGAIVVATHLSSDQRRVGQLARLAELTAASANPVVLLGDFNCDSATVSAALGPGYALANLPSDALPTRPDGAGHPGPDHRPHRRPRR